MNHMIPLEINVISAQIFKNVNFFSKMDRLYTVVELLADPSSSSSSASVHVKRTTVSKHSESGPFWWSKIIFQIEESKLMHYRDKIDGLWLAFHVKCPKTLIPDKVVGTVRIPVSELLEYYYSSGNIEEIRLGPHKRVAFTFCSSRSGKSRGVLYLSYMFGSGEYKGIMSSEIGEPLLATDVPSAPYIGDDDVDLPVSTQTCDEEYRRYDSFETIPSAPYLSEEDLA